MVHSAPGVTILTVGYMVLNMCMYPADAVLLHIIIKISIIQAGIPRA